MVGKNLSFLSTSQGKYRLPNLPEHVERTRIQTLTNAEVTWTFNVPFVSNPVVSAVCEIDDYKPYWVQITDLTTTSVTFMTFSSSSVDTTAYGTVTTTSSTSNNFTLGALTFTVGAALGFVNGQPVQAYDTSYPSYFMSGTITSYSGTTLVLNITNAPIPAMGIPPNPSTNWTITSTGLVNPYQSQQNCWVHASAREAIV